MSDDFTDIVVADLNSFYKKFNPEKLEQLDGIIADARKKGIPSSKMFELLYKRYSVTPFGESNRESIVERSKKLYPKLSMDEIISEMRRVELEGLDSENMMDSYFSGLQRRSVSKTVQPNMKEVVSVAQNQQVGRMRALSTAKSKASVDEVMADEAREWLLSVVGELDEEARIALGDSQGTKMCDSLRDGVLLQILLQKLKNPNLLPADLKRPKSNPSAFQGRDNVSRFIAAVQKDPFLLRPEVTFTDTDLCDGKNDRQVVTCLLALAKITYTQGVAPAPPIVKYDQEIEEQAKHISEVELDKVMEQDDEEEEQVENVEGDLEDLVDRLEDEEGLARENVIATEVRVRKLMLYVLDRTGVPVTSPVKQKEEVTPQKQVVIETPKQVSPPPSSSPTAGGDAQVPKQQQKPVLAKVETVDMPHNPEPGSPKKYVARRGDEVDKKVGKAVNTVMQKYNAPSTKIKRLKEKGQYVIYHKITGKRTVCFVRVVQKVLMIRVGGGWEDFEDYLQRRMVDWEGPSQYKQGMTKAQIAQQMANNGRLGGPGAKR